MADPELPGGWLPPKAPERPAPTYRPPLAEQQPLPSFVHERAQQGTNGLAVTAIVCAVTSMGLLVLSLGLSFFFSLPLGVAGWVCAARSAPDQNPGQRKTGHVLSVVAIALSVAAAVAWLLLIAAGVTPEELQRNLEEELERQRRSS